VAGKLSVGSEAPRASHLGDQLGGGELAAAGQLQQLGSVGENTLTDLCLERLFSLGDLTDPPQKLTRESDLDRLLTAGQARSKRPSLALATQCSLGRLEPLRHVVQVPSKPLDLGGSLVHEVLAVIQKEFYLARLAVEMGRRQAGLADRCSRNRKGIDRVGLSRYPQPTTSFAHQLGWNANDVLAPG
jgi:hypothetical protein